MGKSVFLVAAVITTLVFLTVFLLVRMDEAAKMNELSDEIRALYEEQQASKILQAYMGAGDKNTCLVYERHIARQLDRIYALFYRLQTVESTTFVTPSQPLKRQYLLTSMALWIDLMDVSKTCELGIKPVLYFFPERWKQGQPQSCVECDAMVEQLEIVKSQCPSVRVFAFPAESTDFEFVALLKEEYNVSRAPAIVVDGNVAYSIIPTKAIKEWLGCS